MSISVKRPFPEVKPFVRMRIGRSLLWMSMTRPPESFWYTVEQNGHKCCEIIGIQAVHSGDGSMMSLNGYFGPIWVALGWKKHKPSGPIFSEQSARNDEATQNGGGELDMPVAIMKTSVYIEAEELASELAWINSRPQNLRDQMLCSEIQGRLNTLWDDYFSEDERERFREFFTPDCAA